MSGEIHFFVLSVFVGSPASPWSPYDIERTKQKVFEAENWLRAQVMRYGKNVVFINSAFGSDGSYLDHEMPHRYDSDEKKYRYPSQVLLKMGFRTKNEFIRWVRTNMGCDQCLGIIFSNTTGRSYASPVNTELFEYDPSEYNLECCFLYRYHEDTVIETNAAAIAHEMLHLFGAWDLYELDEHDRDRAAKTQIMFPKSIMLDTHRDIWETQLDEINAWLVGLKEGQDWYRWFEPYQDNYECE